MTLLTGTAQLVAPRTLLPDELALSHYVALAEERLGDVIESFLGPEQSVAQLLARLAALGAMLDDRPRIGEGTRISKNAIIGDDVFIGANCVIHDFAVVRDHSIILDKVVVGHASEIARSMVFSGSLVTHKTTVVDSIIGSHCNIGASVTLASPRIFARDMSNAERSIFLKLQNGFNYDTGLKKFGSVIGDNTRIGMNASASPGVLVGRRSIIYPNLFLRRGYYQPDSIVKLRQEIEVVKRDHWD